MRHAGRRLLGALLTTVASSAILFTVLAQYADHVLLDPGSFSDRAVAVVRTPGVESLVVDTITNHIVGISGDETSVQPVVETAVRQALSNAQVTEEIRSAASLLQSEAVSGTANALTLTLPNVGPVIAANVQSESPALADQVRNLGTITVLDVPVPSTDSRKLHDLATIGGDSSLLVVLTVALIVLALVISVDRARTLRALGLGFLGTGLLAVAIYLVGRQLIVSEFSSVDAQTTARAAWNVYLSGLQTWGFVLAGIGAVLVVAVTASRPRRSRYAEPSGRYA
jgi:hypothetical protein